MLKEVNITVTYILATKLAMNFIFLECKLLCNLRSQFLDQDYSFSLNTKHFCEIMISNNYATLENCVCL